MTPQIGDLAIDLVNTPYRFEIIKITNQSELDRILYEDTWEKCSLKQLEQQITSTLKELTEVIKTDQKESIRLANLALYLQNLKETT